MKGLFMARLNRRQFLGTSAAAGMVLAIPSVSLAAPTAPLATATLVNPTTNILHQGARFGRLHSFSRAEILRMLGAEDLAGIPQYSRDTIMTIFKGKRPYSTPDDNDYWIGASIDSAKDRAEAGQNEIYQRGGALHIIRRRLNDHFRFSGERISEWLNTPNPHLNGTSFRKLMVQDIFQASEKLELALFGPRDNVADTPTRVS